MLRVILLSTFSIILSLSLPLQAQFHDNHWMMGHSGGNISEPNDSLGISILSFYEADLQVEDNQEIDLFFNGGGISISNKVGELVLFTNGEEIRNNQDQVILNGSIEDGEVITPQTNLFLPIDHETEDIYGMLQMQFGITQTLLGKTVTFRKVSVGINQGQGGVIDQFSLNIPDSLTTGELTACRHANGRDWWMLLAEVDKPLLYSILISSDTAKVIDTLHTPLPMPSGLGQAVFSPDGRFYIRFNLVGGSRDGDDFLEIFDFDRCNGTVSNFRRTILRADAAAGGVSVSPSSQYLYVSHYNYIYQYDLWAEDIFATKDTVAIYDGYREWDFFTGRFFMGQLAPDGKIYLNSSSGIKKLHRIEYPDRAGAACEVRQHSIGLPNSNAFTLANHPNYRLGPLDGSPCDTLGLDNVPRAYYRIDRDTLDTLAFRFHDLSFYEPETWSWTFGDGERSTARYPTHTYAEPGFYEVCLTVTNINGQHTHCRTLQLGTVATEAPVTLTAKVFPNPVQDILVFDLGRYTPLRGQWLLYDAAGRLVQQETVWASQAQFDLSDLPAGMYFWIFYDAGRKLASDKFAKVE